MANKPPQDRVSLAPYLRTFALVYALLAAIVGVVVAWFNIENSAMGIITAFAAVSAPAQSFTTTHNRLMTRGELGRFASYGTLITVAITAMLAAGFYLAYVGTDNAGSFLQETWARLAADASIVAIAVPIVLLVTWLVLYLAAWQFGRQAFKAAQLRKTPS